jgi:hypothetical protein
VKNVLINEAAVNTRLLFDEAVSLINRLVYALPSNLDKTQKATRKDALAFLNNKCGGQQEPPFPVEEVKAASAA